MDEEIAIPAYVNEPEPVEANKFSSQP